MTLPKHTITEIAQSLLCGDICYIHKTDGSVENIPSMLEALGMEDDPLWQEILEKIKANADSYIEIRPMESRDAFRVMESFIDEKVKDRSFKIELLQALEKPKPFKQFKYLIDGSSQRQDWFDFQEERTVLYVEKMLKS